MWKHQPSVVPQTICVVGCGGTGSRLIPLVAQFVKTLPYVINPEMLVVDDDVVEDKNLLRQNFIRTDVDKKKAEVIATRYAKAYDIPITPLVERISSSDNNSTFRKTMSKWAGEKRSVLFIMCVDNPDARRDIIRVITSVGLPSTSILIDTGNENDFGQVKFSHLKVGYSYKEYSDLLTTEDFKFGMSVDSALPFLPLDIDYYASMTSETKASCADLDQTMAINTLVAVTAFSFIQNWYFGKPITYHRVDVTLGHGCTAHHYNGNYLSEILNRGRTVPETSYLKEYEFIKSASSENISEYIDKAKQEVDKFNAKVLAAQKAAQAKKDAKAATKVETGDPMITPPEKKSRKKVDVLTEVEETNSPVTVET